MSGASISLKAEDFDKLTESIKAYGDGAEDIINGVLHEYGAERIKEEIHKLLPESGRNWKGKKVAAKRTDPFVSEGGNLNVTVSTKSAYGYLYFPDDGTNTRKHVGNKQFMQRGAESATDDIIERCLAELVKEF